MFDQCVKILIIVHYVLIEHIKNGFILHHIICIVYITPNLLRKIVTK